MTADLPVDEFRNQLDDRNSPLLYFQSLLIWIDLLSGTYISRKPSFANKFQHYFAKNTTKLRLEALTGCHEQVIACLLEIIQLQLWKEEHRSHGNLSMAELVTKGLKLERRLDQSVKVRSRKHSD